MRRNAQQVEVELVEEAVPGRPVMRVPRFAPWLRRVVVRPLSRIPRRTWSALAVLIAVAMVASVAVQGVTAAARDARLARTDGLSVPLDQPLREVWRTKATWAMATTAGGALLLGLHPDRDVIAVDMATGEQLYTVPGRCDVAPEVDLRPFFRLLPQLTARDLLICEIVPPGHGSVDPDAPQTVTINVHDPVDGRLLRSVALRSVGHPHVNFRHISGYGLDAEGRLVAEAWSPRTGRLIWSYRSPQPVTLPEPRMDINAGRDRNGFRLSIAARSLGVDQRMDRRLGTTPPVTVALPDGARATWENPLSTVAGPDGEVRFTAPGRPVLPEVDDGTVPRALPWASRGLVMADATTGERLWEVGSVTDDPRNVVMKIDGAVLVRHEHGLGVYDAATGRARWAAPFDRYEHGTAGMISDGRRVLTIELRADGYRAALVARDLRTGDQQWAAAITEVQFSQRVWLRRLPDGTALVSNDRGVFLALRN